MPSARADSSRCSSGSVRRLDKEGLVRTKRDIRGGRSILRVHAADWSEFFTKEELEEFDKLELCGVKHFCVPFGPEGQLYASLVAEITGVWGRSRHQSQKPPCIELQEDLRGGSPAEGLGDEGCIPGEGNTVIELLGRRYVAPSRYFYDIS